MRLIFNGGDEGSGKPLKRLAEIRGGRGTLLKQGVNENGRWENLVVWRRAMGEMQTRCEKILTNRGMRVKPSWERAVFAVQINFR
jgi:hypothetical protein